MNKKDELTLRKWFNDNNIEIPNGFPNPEHMTLTKVGLLIPELKKITSLKSLYISE